MAFNIGLTCRTKRDSSVWRYFNYEAVADKSTYFVITTDRKQYGRLIARKYTMNLLSHLKLNHTKIHGEVATADNAKKIGVQVKSTTTDQGVSLLLYNTKVGS